MSVKSDIADYANSLDSSLNLTESNISNIMVSGAWEDVCDSVQSENSSITDRSATGTWSVAEKTNYALDHFPTSLQGLIMNGKVVMPYKSTIEGYLARIVYTNNKVYKFPTNNVNYFNSAVSNVKYYGAARYFNSVQSNYETNATSAGNTAVQNYNYAN